MASDYEDTRSHAILGIVACILLLCGRYPLLDGNSSVNLYFAGIRAHNTSECDGFYSCYDLQETLLAKAAQTRCSRNPDCWGDSAPSVSTCDSSSCPPGFAHGHVCRTNVRSSSRGDMGTTKHHAGMVLHRFNHRPCCHVCHGSETEMADTPRAIPHWFCAVSPALSVHDDMPISLLQQFWDGVVDFHELALDPGRETFLWSKKMGSRVFVLNVGPAQALIWSWLALVLQPLWSPGPLVSWGAGLLVFWSHASCSLQ